MCYQVLIPQLDFGRPSTWSHPVTWERVTEPEEEWQCFEEGLSLAATKTVGVQGPARRNRLGLSSDTLVLIAAKRAAHLAQLSYATLVARIVFRQANRAIKAVVSRDA